MHIKLTTPVASFQPRNGIEQYTHVILTTVSLHTQGRSVVIHYTPCAFVQNTWVLSDNGAEIIISNLEEHEMKEADGQLPSLQLRNKDPLYDEFCGADVGSYLDIHAAIVGHAAKWLVNKGLVKGTIV